MLNAMWKVRLFICLLLVLFNYMTKAQPLSKAEDWNCGRNRKPYPYDMYGLYLIAARQKLAVELGDNWDNRQDTGTWRGVRLKITGFLAVSDITGKSCREAVFYRGGCRESQTCSTRFDCSMCIATLASELTSVLCPGTVVGNAFAADCFVRYSDQRFVSPIEQPEWPRHP